MFAHSFTEAGPLDALIADVRPVAPDTPALDAYESFSRSSNLYAIAVVDAAARPVGLINRFKFLEKLSRPFGRDLSMRQMVSAMMDAAPVIVDEGISLDELSGILVDDASRYIFDGFIVTRGGRYLGIGTGHSLFRYLTERKHAALFHLAHHDSLTGLPNRQLFDDKLREALGQAERHDLRVGVLYLDVDRFKAVNDTVGHIIGDALLKSIADRLRAHVRVDDVVARLSGDEFAVILSDLRTASDGEGVAQHLLDALRSPHDIDRHQINVSCSIGVAVFPNDGSNQAALLRAADAAAYHAKQFRNTWQRFSADVHQGPAVLAPAFGSVQRAIEERHLSVVYQPQITVHSGGLFGVEALVRWHDPERGLMSTPELIRLAEDSGLIMAVTDFVLGEAVSQMREWERMGLASGLTLAVNVSTVELREGAIVPMLRRHLQQSGFCPRLLELEVTESIAMLSERSTAAVLNELTALGVRLSIDDFGTGYSSLSRLRRLPVHALKIDRAFVDDIEHRESGALAQAIILMAHSLGLAVTGEGVETTRQRAFLEAQGCDRMQGYLISPPLTTEAMTSYLRCASEGSRAGCSVVPDAVGRQ